VHYTARVDNHVESNASAWSEWLVNSSMLRHFSVPGSAPDGVVDVFESYTAPSAFQAGDIFMLEAWAFTSASDYHGRSQLSAELVGIEVRNASGALVEADVTFIPEPATAGIAALGLLLLGLRRRFTVK
jgi:hypothetical protein